MLTNINTYDSSKHTKNVFFRKFLFWYHFVIHFSLIRNEEKIINSVFLFIFKILEDF